MMFSSGCIPMWRNGRSIRYLEEWYFNKCFRRKTQKKRHIDLYCYLRPRYIFPFEEISWKQRYASAEPSKAWNICNGTRFGRQKDQSFRGQPPVAHKWRTLRGRQPSKTGTIGIQNILSQKKQQNLRSRMIASLAFRKLCRFVSSFAGNRKLRRAGNNGFVFILLFLRRFEKIKIRCEAQILCLFYSSSEGLRKCWTLANLLRLYYSSATRKRKLRTPRKKRNFRSTIFLYSMDTCFWWLPSSKWSPFVGNWRLPTERLGFASVESCAMAYLPCFWRLRWSISLPPRNFL